MILVIGCSHLPSFIYTHTQAYDGGTKVINVYIDKDFTENDMLKIGAALDDWNYALNNYIRFNIVSTKFDMEPSILKTIMSSNGLMILKIDSNSSFIPKPDTDGVVLAFTDMVSRHVIMVIRDRFDNPNYEVANDKNGLTLAMRHELGHVLGLKHILSSTKTLMAPKLTLEYDQCIDKTTIEAVAKEQHLNVHRLNYCTYEE